MTDLTTLDAIRFELEAGKLHLEQANRLASNEHPYPPTIISTSIRRELGAALLHYNRAQDLT